MMLRGIAFLLLLFYTTSIQAQNFKSDMAKIGDAYRNLNSYTIEMQYRLYADENSTNILEKESATFKKKGNMYYANMFDKEIFINRQHIFIIDRRHELIMADKVDLGMFTASEKASQNFSFNIDSLLSEFKSIADQYGDKAIKTISFSEGNGKASYTIKSNIGEYEKMIFSFDTKTYLISDIVLVYNNVYPVRGEEMPSTKPKIVIEYKKTDKSVVPDVAFDFNHYATVTNSGALNIKQSYKNYRVINHLDSFENQLKQSSKTKS